MGCINSTNDILRPNLSCPGDLSQLLFRFINPKSLGIIKGRTELLSVDMSGFFLPIGSYTLTEYNLCPNDILRVDGGSVMTQGKRREFIEFDMINFQQIYLGENVTALLTIEENGTTIDTIGPLPATDFETLRYNVALSLGKATVDDCNVEVSKYISYYSSDNISKIVLYCNVLGKSYEYKLALIHEGSTETIVPTVIQTPIRYPHGALKLIFMYINFNTLDSNSMQLDYAFDSDVQENGIEGATWRKTGSLFIQSGGEDVTETDTNKIETVWLKNTTKCTVTVRAILVN